MTASTSIFSTNSKYQFENYLISAVNDDISIEEKSDDDNSLFIIDGDFDIPTTNAGEFVLEVEDVSPTSVKVSGHIILNQCCSLLIRSSHRVRGFSDFKTNLCNYTR